MESTEEISKRVLGEQNVSLNDLGTIKIATQSEPFLRERESEQHTLSPSEYPCKHLLHFLNKNSPVIEILRIREMNEGDASDWQR